MKKGPTSRCGWRRMRAWRGSTKYTGHVIGSDYVDVHDTNGSNLVGKHEKMCDIAVFCLGFFCRARRPAPFS